jgi:hypothetical protein
MPTGAAHADAESSNASPNQNLFMLTLLINRV